MYGLGPMLGAAATTTVAAVTLPNTGSDMIVTLALGIVGGLLTWGILYARAN